MFLNVHFVINKQLISWSWPIPQHILKSRNMTYSFATSVSRTFLPTLPCYHFHVDWRGSCWWVALSFHWEGRERSEMSPGAGEWCCTQRWECISRRRTWSWEGHSWEQEKRWHILKHVYTTQGSAWQRRYLLICKRGAALDVCRRAASSYFGTGGEPK